MSSRKRDINETMLSFLKSALSTDDTVVTAMSLLADLVVETSRIADALEGGVQEKTYRKVASNASDSDHVCDDIKGCYRLEEVDPNSQRRCRSRSDNKRQCELYATHNGVHMYDIGQALMTYQWIG
jgi:hypothetical protein